MAAKAVTAPPTPYLKLEAPMITWTALTTLPQKPPAVALGDALEQLDPAPTGVGVFEMEEYSKGTFAVADQIAASSALSVVGGGDSVSALKLSGNQAKVTFVSTAGGAFMEMMEGKTLPGIAALDR